MFPNKMMALEHVLSSYVCGGWTKNKILSNSLWQED